MRSRLTHVLARWLRWFFGVFVISSALCVAMVQVQQRIYKHHVERLLEDLSSVQLHKSTWPDAQQLMRNWGRWGHYEGTCEPASCRYDILLEDASARLLDVPDLPDWGNWVLHILSPVYYLFGGRLSTVSVSILVKDGYIVRSGIYARLSIPPDRQAGDEFGYGLLAGAVSLPRLARYRDPESFERDPYYTVVRPGGCEICMDAMLVYSDHTPQKEVARITAINSACFGTGPLCRTVEDLLPASEPFHLYEGALGGRPEAKSPEPEIPAHACAVPLWVRGRDASAIEVVKGGNTSTKGTGAEAREVNTVTVVGTLKGKRMQQDQQMDVALFQPARSDSGVAEKMVAGERYFLLSFSFFDPIRDISAEFGEVACSTIPASPQAEAELRRGMALDDELPGEELPHSPF